jgi:hypothetical protein
MAERLVTSFNIAGLTAQRFADIFLGKLIEALPEAAPSMYGFEEPLENKFTGLNDARDWDYVFIWRSDGRLNCEGTAFLGNRNTHGKITVSLEYRNSIVERLKNCVKDLAVRLNTAFAYMHSVTANESDGPNSQYDRWYPLSMGVTTHDLRKGIPELAWLTVLGRDYRQMLSDELLGGIAAATSQALSSDHWELTVTDSLSDLFERYDYFEKRREAVKHELGSQLFQGYDDTAPRKRIPEFRMS